MYERMIEPQGQSGSLQIMKLSPGFDPRATQLVASHTEDVTRQSYAL
jgi:hypothetical protein